MVYPLSILNPWILQIANAIEMERQISNSLRAGKQDRIGTESKIMREECGKGHRILDLGCAEGPYSHLFTRENECWGLDSCPKRMLLGENNAMNKGYKALIVGEGLSLPFADASFDIVICTEVIEHVVEVRQLIKEINRVLIERGKLILSTPNLVSLGNRVGMFLGKGLKFTPFGFLGGGFYPLTSWNGGSAPEMQCSFASIRYPEQPLHVRFFTFESLRKLLQQTGFEVKRETVRGFASTAKLSPLCRVFRNWADDLLVVATKS